MHVCTCACTLLLRQAARGGMCTRAHTRAHTCIHVHAHMHVHTHVHTHAYTCMHICTHAYEHAHIHSNIHNAHMHTHMHTCIHTCIHTYTRTYMHACIHTHTHTYIHTQALGPPHAHSRGPEFRTEDKGSHNACIVSSQPHACMRLRLNACMRKACGGRCMHSGGDESSHNARIRTAPQHAYASINALLWLRGVLCVCMCTCVQLRAEGCVVTD